MVGVSGFGSFFTSPLPARPAAVTEVFGGTMPEVDATWTWCRPSSQSRPSLSRVVWSRATTMCSLTDDDMWGDVYNSTSFFCTSRLCEEIQRTSAYVNNASITRGVQKVPRLTQLITRYVHQILSLFNTVCRNWNALGSVFLQSSDSTVEEMLILLFQTAIAMQVMFSPS